MVHFCNFLCVILARNIPNSKGGYDCHDQRKKKLAITRNFCQFHFSQPSKLTCWEEVRFLSWYHRSSLFIQQKLFTTFLINISIDTGKMFFNVKWIKSSEISNPLGLVLSVEQYFCFLYERTDRHHAWN